MYQKASIQEILSSTSHRPWMLPRKKWNFYQEWNEPVFLHWEVEPDIIKGMIPKNVELDTLHGKAWVSLVPFQISIKPRYLPSFPPISSFNEINLRTYVKHEGKTGVYFLQIEGEKALSCWIARLTSGLPFLHSKIRRSKSRIIAQNEKLDSALEIDYQPLEFIANPSSTDLWLSERYALFVERNQEIFTYEVHHLPWKLHKVDVHAGKISYPKYGNILQGEPQITHYSPGTQVIAFPT